MMLNLIANALKFTFEGSIRVAIIATATGIRFLVSDTGVGIAPDNISNLFKLVGKLQQTYEINETGVGLGLHISQQLVHQLGGIIEVISELGQGSTFYFEITEHECEVKEENIVPLSG